MSQSFRNWLEETFKGSSVEAPAETQVPTGEVVMYPTVAHPVGTVVCHHPVTTTHLLPNGGDIIKCMSCAKHWQTDGLGELLPAAVEEAIDPVISNLASELSQRRAQTLAQLVDATAGTVRSPLPAQAGATSASFQYSDDFATVQNLKANAPFVSDQTLQASLRRKAMEDAARAAAAAFDMDKTQEAPALKLDGERKLKVVS